MHNPVKSTLINMVKVSSRSMMVFAVFAVIISILTIRCIKISNIFTYINIKLFNAKETSMENIFIRKDNGKLITEESLLQFNYDNDDKIYIAILGQVFDVTSGKKHYGKSGSYSYFTGKDGSRSFATGEFTDSNPGYEISDLTGSQFLEIYKWLQFYNSKYKFIGKVVGKFYDENGEPLDRLVHAHDQYSLALADEITSEEINHIFPSCNVRWKENEGSTFWCTFKSGGVDRDWTGVPRKYFDQHLSNTRCVCARNFGKPSFNFIPSQNNGDLNHPNLGIYDGCDPNANECFM